MSTIDKTQELWWVEGEDCSYANKFAFDEAVEVAKQDSLDYGCYMAVRRDLNARPSLIFHSGWTYLPEKAIE